MGPYHLVSAERKHHGPFTTELDAALARNLASFPWNTAKIMNKQEFEEYLFKK